MMDFKYYNENICIQSNNLTTIAQAVTQVLEQEKGCRRVPNPFHLVSDQEQVNRPLRETTRDLWIIGLFIGTNAWTGIKTSPKKLLCQRAKDTSRPRLSALAIQLGCNAFYLEVREQTAGFLLEADANGRTFLSGCPGDEDPENYQFCSEQIDLPDLISQFFLLEEVPQLMQAAIKVNQEEEVQRREAEAQQLMRENRILDFSYEQMEEINEALQGHTQRIDRTMAKVVDESKSYWYLGDLLDYTYAKVQQLEAKGAQILYFQPPVTYNPSIPQDTPPPTESDTVLGLDTIAYDDAF